MLWVLIKAPRRRRGALMSTHNIGFRGEKKRKYLYSTRYLEFQGAL